jgi:large subunit ribosomal protein L29
MKGDDIRALADDELRARVLELEEERFRLRFRSATEALEDPLRQRMIRRDVARLQTILRERSLAAQPTARKSGRASKASRSTTAR